MIKRFFNKDIFVIDYGSDNPPLLLVHAFPMDNEMWNNQVEFFRDKMRVITFDIRGFGKSKDSFYGLYTMEDFANDVIDIIEHLNLKSVNICGLSMGGYIVQRAVIKNQDFFRSMVLADTRGEREDNKGTVSRSLFIESIKKNGIGDFADNFMKKLLYHENYENNEVYNFISNKIQEQKIEGLIGASIAMSTRTNTLNRLSELNIPSLIMVGENDSFTPLPYSIRLHEALKNSELKKIKKSGHLSPIESPDCFNNFMFNFFKLNSII